MLGVQARATPQTPQQNEFDRKYISGLEIRQRLGVAHCSLTFAQQRGDLPKPIKVGGGVYVWERTEVKPYLLRWDSKLKARRGQSA